MRYRRFGKIPVCPAGMILTLAVLVAILTGPGCHAAADILMPIGNKPPPLSQLVPGIVTRSAGLNYITEQDSEVFAFYRNTPVKELTGDVFLALLRRPKETQIVTESWARFFQIRTQNDPSGRWRHLQEYLEANLTNLTVFRLPRAAPYDAQYDLYAVGLLNGETVVGVQMFGVAT